MAKFITLTSNVVSKEKLFKRREQYCYVDRIKMDVTCPLCGECTENTKNVIHYRLNIDGEYYYIPSFAAVKYDKVWFEEEKDIRKQIRRENMQPSDLSAMYKEVTGNDLDNTYDADRNISQEIGNINFDNYGWSSSRLGPPSSEMWANEQPTDMLKTFKDVTGREIDNTYLADRNRLQEIYSVNFSDYGVSSSKLGPPASEMWADEKPADFVKTFKEVTGRDLDNTYIADRNRTKEIYNINFDNYGVSDPKLAKSTSNYYDILYNRRRQCLVQESTEPDTLHQGLNVYFPEQEIIYCGETTTITLTPTITGIKDRYTYLWSTGETTETIEVTINPGEEKMFSIQVTDDIGCSRVASVIVKVGLYGSFDESFDCSFDIGCLTC